MIGPELTDLLEPLERFEAIRRRVARLGDRLCDLSYANFYGGAQQAAVDVLRRALDDDRLLGLQYAPFGGQTLARRAVADALRTSHGLPTTFADVVLTPGAMAALQLALRVVGGEGDEVVIPVPCWLDHPLYVRSLGMRARLVPLREPDFTLDLDAIEQELTPRTRAVLLSTPNNPTGSQVTPEAARGLRDVLAAAERRTGAAITVIADETHRDFSPAGTFTSVATEVARTLIVYSFGKRHFMQGQRLGYLAVSPHHPERRDTTEELVRWTRITGTATPTALMQRAIPGLLGIEQDLDGLRAVRAHLRDGLERLGYEVVASEATLFLYVRTPTGFDDSGFVEALAGKGVLVLPASCFHHDGFVRLAVGATPEAVDRALQTLAGFAPASSTMGVAG